LIATVNANTIVYTDSNLSPDTFYEYGIQAVVDANNISINGQLAKGVLVTLSAANNNTPAIIGGVVGGSMAFLIIVVLIYATYRKIRKVKQHVEDMALDGVEQIPTEFVSKPKSSVMSTKSNSHNSINSL